MHKPFMSAVTRLCCLGLLACSPLVTHAHSSIKVKRAIDVNPDPHIFETTITAAPHVMRLPDGQEVTVFAYNGMVPGPEIRVKRGDRVIVHFKNELPDDFPSTIHWHGIELNNKSDGTPVTQDVVQPGESYTYDFIVPRGGVFWYHPHVRGAETVIAGLYGSLIVKQPEERALRRAGVLPKRDITMVLSDIAASDGELRDLNTVPMLETMNGTEGNFLLVNGQVMPTLKARIGEGLRLRLINTSISRYFRLSLPGHTIYRVGGEGGLLSRVRVEGGQIPATRMALNDDYDGYTGMIMLDQGYDKGEILLAPAQRADVVIIPNGEPGDELIAEWKDFARGRHQMAMMPNGMMMMVEADDDGQRPGVDLFKIKLKQGRKHRHHHRWARAYSIAEGDDLVPNPGRLLPERQESQIKLQADMMAMMMGMPRETWFKIDDYSGVEGRTNFRTAAPGEVLEWETHNYTDMHHPFHLHGFSFQPTMFATTNQDEGYVDVWYVNEENEYVDTVNIPPRTSAYYLFQVEDRPEYGASPGAASEGGANGDWVFHCHIFQHGENGMMSFLRVSDAGDESEED